VNTKRKPTTTENYPSGKTAHPRNRMGVPNKEKPKTRTGKNKIKTRLTRPASLEGPTTENIAETATLFHDP
jgi:hypothetical protein